MRELSKKNEVEEKNTGFSKFLGDLYSIAQNFLQTETGKKLKHGLAETAHQAVDEFFDSSPEKKCNPDPDELTQVYCEQCEQYWPADEYKDHECHDVFVR